MFVQSEFGFSKRSYHCKHGAAAVAPVAAAVVVDAWSLDKAAFFIVHSDLSLCSSLFVIPRKRALFPMHDFFFSFSVRLRANIRSFKSRTHAERVPRTSGSSSAAVLDHRSSGDGCSIQIPIAKRGVSLSLSLCAVLLLLHLDDRPQIPHRPIDRPTAQTHTHTRTLSSGSKLSC